MDGIEVWLEIEEAPRYLVSSLGRVQNRMTGRILSQSPNTRGYPKVRLVIGNRLWTRPVHKLVSEAFFDGDHSDLEVNHDDGCKTNNFIANLEWTTHSKNMKHAVRTGLFTPSGGSKKVPVRIVETGEIFDSLNACARAIGGRHGCIQQCLNGRQRSHRGYTFEYVDD